MNETCEVEELVVRDLEGERMDWGGDMFAVEVVRLCQFGRGVSLDECVSEVDDMVVS